MSWLRIEGRMPQHHKVAPLSDAAFRLHVTAMAWCVEGHTDGKIPFSIPKTLTRSPTAKRLASALTELESFGVWRRTEAGWEIHDFLEWNLSAAEIKARHESKSRAGAVGGARSAQAKAKQEPSTCLPSASAQLQQGFKQNSSPSPIPYPYQRDTPPHPSDGSPPSGDSPSGVFAAAAAAPEPKKLRLVTRRKPQAAYPEGLAPLPRHAGKCAELGLDCAAQFARFANYHQAKGSLFADWHRAFDTWISNAPGFAHSARPNQRPRQPDSGYSPFAHATEIK